MTTPNRNHPELSDILTVNHKSQSNSLSLRNRILIVVERKPSYPSEVAEALEMKTFQAIAWLIRLRTEGAVRLTGFGKYEVQP